MTGFYRLIIGLFLLLAAISCYSAGIQSGVFIFIILGFLLEGAFWIGILAPKKRSQSSS